jgi:hypothetical protein
MSKFERRYRRGVLRPLLVFAALAALAVVLTPTGSAKPTPPPSGTYQACLTAGDSTAACSNGGYSVIPGDGANAEYQVTISNNSTSTVNLDWANVSIPAGIGVSIDTTHSPQPASYTTYASTSTSTTLQLRGLGITPGNNKTVAFFVNSTSTSCTDGNWSTAARSSSNGNAVIFTGPSASGGLTSLVAVNCQLAFQTNPAAALPTKTITGSPYSESGTAVTVATPNLPVALNGGGVSLGIKTGSFDAASSFTGTGPVALVGSTTDGTAAAAFGSLKATGTGGPFTLKASAAGFADAVSSPSFAITKTGEACTGTCAPLATQDDSGNPLIQVNTSAGFGFVGSSPSSVPLDNLGNPPAGCANWTPLQSGVAGFVEFDGRTDPVNSSMTVTYYVSMKAIKARYGKNVGQQFIPICIGVKKVDPITGLAVDCTPSDDPVWHGDTLDGTGAFIPNPPGGSGSICGPDGYSWDIISSFQDKLDQTVNPVVTSWGTVTLGGQDYRAFVMNIPAGLDLRGGT